MAADPDIVVVGAGAAGLAAAAVLRRAGHAVTLIEAGRVIGGRAHTVCPDVLGGAPIDAGATWLHAPDHNPLVALARAAGDRLHDAHGGPRLLLTDGHVATHADQCAYDTADESWRAAMLAQADGPDASLAAAGNTWTGQDTTLPWFANVEAWESAIIAAADADMLSLHDWRLNQLPDGDLRPNRGVGALLANRLGPLAGPVRCGVAATAIDWQVPGGVAVHTTAGTLRARACIVTVSTGVLRSEAIAFTPALPRAILSALDGLPMGLLSKLALPLADDALPHLVPGTLVEQRLDARGAPMMLLGVRPEAAPYVTGFLGGRHAWSFAGRENDALHEARARLATAFGAAALQGVGRDGFVSRWGSDPLFLGAYAYARPGHAGSRAELGRPLAGGRLVLAGEACRTDGLAGTVGGAMRDGERAAHAVLAGLGAAAPFPHLVSPGDD